VQVWQGGTVLIVVENPILARQVNTRNYARPRFLLPFAGKQQKRIRRFLMFTNAD
jgi:hypothetical protein